MRTPILPHAFRVLATWLPLAIVALFATSWLSCTDQVAATCLADDECAVGVCESGRCVVPDGGVGADATGDRNACGGVAVLRLAGADVTPGDACGCGGTAVCNGTEAVRCANEVAPNACGGCGTLPGAIGTSCGSCGGRWTCGGVGSALCVGAARQNGCGGCERLEGAPGRGCGEDAGEAVWTCAGANAVTCQTPLDGENACGGDGALVHAGQPALPGEDCTDDTRLCGPGVLVCDPDGGSLRCTGVARNAAGGCGALLGQPGTECGCGGTWIADAGTPGGVVCAGGAPNTCGGCETLRQFPGTDCGGGDVAVCISANDTVCVSRTADRNACGGTSPLAGPPGAVCGSCNSGSWVCDGPNRVNCAGDRGVAAFNPCDSSCDLLTGGVLGGACGVCDTGRLVCGTNNALRCEQTDPDAARNACGGCAPLVGEPDTTCGTCSTWTCAADGETLGCVADPSLPGCVSEPVTCADLVPACSASNRVCIPHVATTPARCGDCLPNFQESGGLCVPTTGPVTCSTLAPTCAEQNRVCVPGTGSANATCGACVTGATEVGGVCRGATVLAPTNVQASDGTSGAYVSITWNGVSGATGYHVFRNGEQITSAPVTSNAYDDTTAPAAVPGVVTGLSATTNRATDVQVTWTATTPPAGTTQTYAVVAIAGAQQSGQSASDTGYRAAQPITRYEVEVRGTWTAAGTGTSYTDSAAPAGTITLGNPTATTNRTDGIQVAVAAVSTTAGTNQTYRVRAVNAAGTGTVSSNATGRRSVGTPTYQWLRATDIGSGGSFTTISGATTASHLDTSMTAGQERWYRVVANATGVASVARPDSGGVYGRRVATCADRTCETQNRVCVAHIGGTDATCGACASGYTEVAGTCSASIAPAPTNVQASDGTNAAHVAVTWTAVSGASGYHVFRGGTQLTTTPLTTTSYNDTTAPAGAAPGAVTGAAATTNRTADVQVTWTAITPPAGATQTYTVVAIVGAQQSAQSASDTGYRAAQPISRYEVEVRGTWTAAGTGTSYTDSAAPAGTITLGNPTATTNRTDGIQVSVAAASTTAGTNQTYRVRAVNAAGTGTLSSNATGHRNVGTPTYQWQRSTTSGGSFSNVSGATSASLLDTSMSAGQERWYRVVASATGATSVTRPESGGVRGLRVTPGSGSGELGEPCTTDANCPPDTWCPTDTTERRCSPRPEVAAGVQMPFQYIPAGSFMMGSPAGELGRSSNEAQVSVTLTRPFFVQRTEVTQAQWTALSSGTNPSCFQSTTGTTCTSTNANPNGPVERVSWWSLFGYANALSIAQDLPACYTIPASGCTGAWQAGTLNCGDVMPTVMGGNVYTCTGYRLLTEAEWEYAARSGTTTATYAGDLTGTVNNCSTTQANLDGIAWWCRNSGSLSQTVGGKTPNGWGLYDMLGNVWEWTWDRHTATLPGGTDPRFESSGSLRVFRGGSWGDYAQRARAAFRDSGTPGAQGSRLGVRLARTGP